MTNHWADIANSTFVLIWGANPVENHPACVNHINRARFPKQSFAASDPRSQKAEAKLVVVDPRQTRSALMCDASRGDRYIRIRPGTDIALQNGVLRYIISQMESATSSVSASAKAAFFSFLNQTSNGTFYTDGSATTASSSGTPVPGSAKYTDARFLVNATGTDYVRDRVLASSGAATTAGPDNTTISNFPLKAATVTADSNTVYNRLKAHVDPYTTAVVADICGCSPDDVTFLADAIIANSRCSSGVASVSNRSVTLADAAGVPAAQFLAHTRITAGSVVVTDSTGTTTYVEGTDYTVDYHSGTIIRRAAGSITAGQVVLVSFEGAPADARSPLYRATTILYAMGQTQHTYGAQNIKGFANLQSLMGNMGRAGGGINALRGIHNVQGSTDMGLLFGNIPGYSGNPTTQVDGGTDWRTTPSTNNAFGKYMDGLWGNPLSGTGGRAQMDSSYDDAYNTATSTVMALQQRGFYNMTLKWFGDYASIHALTGTAKRAAIDACYSLWPKGNGDDHITMFRQMATGVTKALISWGQNPAVTEPNQGAIRAGLENLDLLVCVDLFENETAACSRKSTGVTFLIPTAAHVEKAGSVTNSGRTLQWRYKASDPAGNTKDDNELLLRLARALDDANAFSHIKAVWDANGITYDTSVYKQLYANPYGGYTGTGTGFSALSGNAEVAAVRKYVNEAISYSMTTVTGSEWVAESVYREITSPVASGGTLWIYTGAYNAGGTWTTDNKASGQAPWAVQNRAKSRDNADDNFQLAFHGWGYSWLVNRRVLYNNGEVLGDVTDYYMEPESCVHLFAAKDSTTLLNYSRWYRKNHALKDVPSPVLAGVTSSPHYAGNSVSLAGRFPSHTEPYETPRQDLLAAWGRNTKGTGAWDLVKDDTRVAGRGFTVGGGRPVTDPSASTFPLVLTSIRCVEHFQGGPITRNNWLNVELEPEPWIELNSTDARKYGIKDGDRVRVITARMVDDSGATVVPPSYGNGFRARVGSGLSASQKVGPGTVAIPWHWGERGLSTGSRANDLCIDACDANSVIPEYKACLCRLEKM